MNRLLVASLPLLLQTISLSSLALADDCPCGYTTGSAVFTEVLETDFTHLKEMAEVKDLWQVQEWLSQKDPKTPNRYTRNTKYGNIIPGDENGVQLLVHPAVNDVIGSSEMRTSRNDFKYGTFRLAMKTPKQSGTCAAFFWVR